MKIHKLHWSKLLSAATSLILLLTNIFPVGLAALSSEQRRVIDSGARYFNVEQTPLCSSGGGSGGPANLAVGKDFSLGTDPKERRVNLMKALMADYGLTAEQAAGPVGNFMYESGGAHLPPDVNEGETQGAPPKFRGGYGWAQWTGGRQRALINFAVSSGYMGSDRERATDAADYAYLKKELNESYQRTVTELKKQSTPEDAAVSFEDTFENAGKPNLTQRKANARQAFSEFGGGASGDAAPTGTTNSSCSSSAGATIVGQYAFPLKTAKSGIKNRSMFSGGTASRSGHPYIAYDILVEPNVPVVAFLSGTVTRISEDKCPGRFISVYNQESNLTVSYLHLDFTNHVPLGTQVQAGQQIGLVGASRNGCGTPHLHIDAATGNSRPGCKRESCPTANQALFVDIGPQLYETYQALPE